VTGDVFALIGAVAWAAEQPSADPDTAGRLLSVMMKGPRRR
ncbi:MAG: hypothetical protein JWL58_1652, partial [Streptosporangiaceae bacterium]|jgi:hypothetical protein|nr:hypothetical protein [Streptosporangiaceae bacterium]